MDISNHSNKIECQNPETLGLGPLVKLEESDEAHKLVCPSIALRTKSRQSIHIRPNKKTQLPTEDKCRISKLNNKWDVYRIKEEFRECAGKQLFNKKWLQIPEFQEWLEEGLMPYQAFCSACNMSLVAGKSEIIVHSKSKNHVRSLHLREDTSIQSDLTTFEDDTGEKRILRIIDLRCDSLSIPSEEMRYTMIEAPGGDTSFNSDTAAKEFEAFVANLLNMESGLFFPTHVMANLVAVLAHCQSRGSAVIAGDESDISFRNREALVKFGGLHFRTVKNKADGTFLTEDLESLLRDIDFTFPLSCLVCYECPHARMGGKIPPQEWIDQVKAIRATSSIFLHCDGTRLINASLAQNLSPSTYVKGCDSVTLAIDKGLGAPLGAVLVGSECFIHKAKSIRDSIGGHIHQAGTFTAAGKYAFEQILGTVDSDHSNAKAIAIGIARENSPLLSVEPVHTNIVHVHCKTSDLTATQLQQKLSTVSHVEIDGFSEEKEAIMVLCQTINEHTVSLMIHNQLTYGDVKSVIQKFVDIIKEIDDQIKEIKAT